MYAKTNWKLSMLYHGLPPAIVDKLFIVFQKHVKIERVLLYGSRAIGNYKPGSDIDLCIESKTLNLTELLEIENQLDDLLLPWKIDLSVINSIDNPDLLNHIKTKGIMFYP